MSSLRMVIMNILFIPVTFVIGAGLSLSVVSEVLSNTGPVGTLSDHDDHGDTPAEATFLAAGVEHIFENMVPGVIHAVEDVDYFRIELPEQSYLRVMVWESSPPKTLHMELLNGQGQCVVLICDKSHFQRVMLRLSPGTYYVRFSAIGEGDDPNLWDYGIQYDVAWWVDDDLSESLRDCAAKDTGFDDPLYGCQDFLNNRDNPGEDINVEPAWESGAFGEGVKVVVVDHGVNPMHEDLLGTVDTELSASVAADGELYVPYLRHGTEVAGVIAAQHNDVGIRGIAPGAEIISYRALVGRRMNDALAHQHVQAAVSNNSWGYVSVTHPLLARLSVSKGISQGISEGFYGKGTAYFFVVASGWNSNLDDIENYYAITPVCAVDKEGRADTSGGGPESGGYGANLWVCAPGSAYTTSEHYMYYESAGGSFSTAMASGAAALMRGVNPELTWRDVKLILAESARRNHASHSDWDEGAVKYRNPEERYAYNPNYGFGVVDAGAAVALAESWVNLPEMATVTVNGTGMQLPDMPASGPQVLETSVSIQDDGESTPLFIEHIEVELDLRHDSVRDLEVKLVAPDGGVADLLWPLPHVRRQGTGSTVSLAATQFLGENPVGEWSLQFADHIKRNKGKLRSWRLIVRGHRPNSPVTSLPTISGTAQVGETLTAETSAIEDADGLSNVAYNYQWLAADTEIAGATSSNYTLAEADEGKTIRVKVSFTDDAENQESLTSEATEAVQPKANSPSTGQPTISGTAQVGETLTADTSGISDAEGLTNAAFDYQWVSDDGTSDNAVEGATGTTYSVQTGDAGKAIKVRVSFADDAGHQESVISDPTARIPGIWAGTVTVGDGPVGSDAVGYSTFVSGMGFITNPDFESNGVSYTVLAVAYNHEGLHLGLSKAFSTPFALHVGTKRFESSEASTSEGSESYIHTWSQPGLNWSEGDSVLVVFAEGKTSEPQDASTNSAAIGTPTIGGTLEPGQTLTASTLGISDAEGLANATFSYQWIANDGKADTDIQGATVSTYTLTDANEGKTIKVRVSFTDDAGNEETLTSAATAEVAAKPNSPATGAPAIRGAVLVDETLTADTSGISDADELDDVSFSYQWVAGGSDISGATGSTYTLTASDQGQTVQVRVSFTDDAGNEETLTSAATAAVAATFPGTPRSLQVQTAGTGELEATWQQPESNGGSDVTGYRVQWKLATGSWDTEADVSSATATGTSHTITSLSLDTEYAVRVIATNSAGDGPPSAEQRETAVAQASEQREESTANTAATGATRHQWHGAGGGDADGGHLGHRRRERPGQCQLQLPVGVVRRKRRHEYSGRNRLHLYPGSRRRGPGLPGQGVLHRRRRPPGIADQRAGPLGTALCTERIGIGRRGGTDLEAAGGLALLVNLPDTAQPSRAGRGRAPGAGQIPSGPGERPHRH